MLGRPLRLVRRASSLPKSTWGSLIEVVPTVLAARVALWVFPYKTVLKMFEPVEGRPARHLSYLYRTAKVSDWVGRTFLGDMPCLSQALAARWLLSRGGYDAELKIGARIEDGTLAAHAWLEHEGYVILGGSDSPTKYAILESMDPTEMKPLTPAVEPEATS